MLVRSCLLVLVVLVVAGCGQSEDDLRRYAAGLERQPGVADVSVGVSTPLPFSVQGSIDVQLEPDVTRTQFDDFEQQACDTDVNASVDFDVAIDISSTTEIHQEHLQRCSTLPARVIELAPALAKHVAGMELVVWNERGVRDSDAHTASLQLVRTGVEGAPTTDGVRRVVDVADTALDTLGEDAPSAFDLRAPAVTITSTPVARAREVLDVARALTDDGYLVVKVDAQQERVLVQLDSGDVAAAEALARRTAPDLDGIRVIDDSVQVQGTDVDDDAIDLAAALDAKQPVWGATASSTGVRVALTDTEDVQRVYAAALDADLAQTRISYSITPSPGVSVSIRPSMQAFAAPALEARVAVIDDLLEPGLHVRTVRFERDGAQAWLDEEHYDDATSIDALRKAVRNSIERHGLDGLRFVTVNNRDAR